MNRKIHLTLLVILGLTLSACASKDKELVAEDTGSNDTTSVVADGPAYPSSNLTKQQLLDLQIFGDPADEKVMYFEYNSSQIDRRSEVIARAHAYRLSQRGGASVTLEGHADERGTRNYNLALGERRAQSVSSLISATGAGNSKFNIVSYGEERPVDPAHNEAAWQKNRRVVIAY